MGRFGNNQQKQVKTPATVFNAARSNLLLVVFFTAVNVILRLISADTYFLFSASVPMAIMDIGTILEASPVLAAIPALTITGLYLLCWALSKKRPGWLVAALVMFVLDTLLLLVLYEISAMIVDVLIHAWVLYYLITGTVAIKKMKDQPELPPEPMIDPMSAPAVVPMEQPAAEYPVQPETAAPVMVNGEPMQDE